MIQLYFAGVCNVCSQAGCKISSGKSGRGDKRAGREQDGKFCL